MELQPEMGLSVQSKSKYNYLTELHTVHLSLCIYSVITKAIKHGSLLKRFTAGGKKKTLCVQLHNSTSL